MKNWKSLLYGLNPYLLSSIMSVLVVLQIISSFFLYNRAGPQVLRYVGWLVFALSGVFGWLPIFTLRKKGEVPQRKSYMHTTILVDSGIYGVVRHPQYLAGALISLALILIAQHWLIGLMGIAAMGLTYLDALKADQYCIEKFGDDYKRYMQKVPRMNFLAGLMRLLQRRKRGEDGSRE